MKQILKIVISILLINNLIIFQVFAIAVSDNDGSAFITKAEFDSLKNDFQSQIDGYNTGIDNKIDGAISSYLAGISIGKDSVDYYKLVYEAFGSSHPIFVNSVKNTQSTNNAEVNINILNRYYVKTNILPDTDYEIWCNNGPKVGETSPSYDAIDKFTGTRIVPNAAHYGGNMTQWNFHEALDMEISIPSCMLGQQSWVPTTSTACGSYIWTDTTYNPENKLKGTTITTEKAVGEGVAYVVHNTPAGNIVIREYASSIWPLCNGNINFHQYKDYYATNYSDWKTYHLVNNGMPITTSQTLTMPAYTDWGTITTGTSKTDESTTSGAWGDLSIRLFKVIDGVDYSKLLWGKTKDGTNDIRIYAVNNDVLPNSTTKTVTLSSSTYKASYYSSTILKTDQTNNLPQNKLNYGKPSINVRNLKLSDISNDTLTSLMGSVVYMGEGVPLVKCSSDDVKIKCKIKVATGDSTHNKVNILVSDDKLSSGLVKSGNKTIYSAELTVGTEYEFEIDGEKDKIYWCNLVNKDSGYEAWIDSFTFVDVTN